MNKAKNIAQHVVEWLLVLVFLTAAYGEVTTAEPVVQGILGMLFSGPVITVIYATLFVVMALTLAAGKVLKNTKLRKHALLAMYLTTVYTISLSLALFGLGDANIIDDGLIGLFAAACWLRLKQMTDWVPLTALLDPDTLEPKDLPPKE